MQACITPVTYEAEAGGSQLNACLGNFVRSKRHLGTQISGRSAGLEGGREAGLGSIQNIKTGRSWVQFLLILKTIKLLFKIFIENYV